MHSTGLVEDFSGAEGTRQSHGLNFFSPSWTKMFESSFLGGAEWPHSADAERPEEVQKVQSHSRG